MQQNIYLQAVICRSRGGLSANEKEGKNASNDSKTLLLTLMSVMFLIVLAVRRKLAFVGKEGYDIFGNIALFAPRIKWEKLEDIAEDIKQDATAYENAYNDIMSSINRNEDFRQVSQKKYIYIIIMITITITITLTITITITTTVTVTITITLTITVTVTLTITLTVTITITIMIIIIMMMIVGSLGFVKSNLDKALKELSIAATTPCKIYILRRFLTC